MVGVGFQDPTQMDIAQDNDVVHTLTSDRSDQPFGKAILPRRSWCGRLVPDAHGAQSACDDGAINAMPIANEVLWGLMPRKSLRDLAHNPFRGRFSNVFGIPGSGFRHIQDAYCAPLIIAERLEQMIASLRQGHVDQTARSDAMCAGDDKTCPEFELHHRKFKEALDRERRSFLKSSFAAAGGAAVLSAGGISLVTPEMAAAAERHQPAKRAYHHLPANADTVCIGAISAKT
jgi:hypothetical protein